MSERLSKEEYAKKKKQERQEVHDKSNKEAMEIVRSQDRFLSFLNLYARLNYTYNNALLIHAENPDATEIKDFVHWKEEGFPVRKYEEGITILEPGVYIRKDGSSATGYNLKKVFDISQTNKTPTEKTYNLKDVRDALVFGDEEKLEGYSLSDCIDYYCGLNGEVADDFAIACANYLVKKRYGVTPYSFNGDVIQYFKDVTQASDVKKCLKKIDVIYREITNKINRGLYIKEQESLNYEQ